MTVTINKTDGTVLSTVADGAIDISSCDLTLVGKLYKNYGEIINENFVKLLENFASASGPVHPIIGQIWYDSTNKSLKVYRESGFVPLARLTSASAEPTQPFSGDLWWDTVDEQLRLYTGSIWSVVAPQYTASQGKTGIFAETIIDTTSANHIAVVVYQQGQKIAIFSKDPVYTPQIAISGFVTIGTGLTLSNITNFKLNGTSTNSDLLDNLDSAQFVRSDIDDETSGIISFKNIGGINVGPNSDLKIQVDSTTVKIIKPDVGSIQYLMGTDLALILNDSEQTLHANGTVTSPSISFINDVDTGLYRSADNTVAITSNGQQMLSVNTATTQINSANVLLTGNLTIGDNAADHIRFVASTLDIPNDLHITTGDITLDGGLEVLGTATFDSDVDVYGNLAVDNNASVTGNLSVGGNLTLSGSTILHNVTLDGYMSINGQLAVAESTTINGMLTVAPTDPNDFRIDGLNRIVINNSGIAIGYANKGDITMGPDNAIYARNIPKYVGTFNGRLANLAILRSHHIATVTRTSAGNYSLTLYKTEGTTFTGDGVTTEFNLNSIKAPTTYTVVFVNSVIISETLYTITNNKIEFVGPVPAGHVVYVSFTTEIPLISAYPSVIGSVNGSGYVVTTGTIDAGNTSIGIQTTGGDYSRVSVSIYDGAN